ncbi:MAG: hypothetical protein WBB24_12040 [Maribacter sp.]
MDNSEKFFDSKMIVNFIIAFTVVLAAVIYYQFGNEIKDEVNTVLVSSLNDVNHSLAEQESTRK